MVAVVYCASNEHDRQPAQELLQQIGARVPSDLSSVQGTRQRYKALQWHPLSSRPLPNFSPIIPENKPMSNYETDILIWSEEQAALLRRLAGGERVNDQVDWENVIDEVESVGSEQSHAVESLLRQALIHMLKAEAWPNSREVPHWRAEAERFRIDAISRFAPSMRQRLDLTKLYRQALRVVPTAIDDQPPQPLPQTCQATLDGLLAEP